MHITKLLKLTQKINKMKNNKILIIVYKLQSTFRIIFFI